MTATKKTATAVDQIEAAVAAAKKNAETVAKAGAEAAVQGYDQAIAMTRNQVAAAFDAGSEAFPGYEEFVALGKDNVDAVIDSGTVLAKSVHDINTIWLGLVQATVRDTVAAANAVFGCTNVPEALGVQMDLVKANYTKLVAENRKMTDLSAKLAEAAMEPISKRVTATVENFAKPLSH
jgi:phasin family protein